jgi:hypothetical protein
MGGGGGGGGEGKWLTRGLHTNLKVDMYVRTRMYMFRCPVLDPSVT